MLKTAKIWITEWAVAYIYISLFGRYGLGTLLPPLSPPLSPLPPPPPPPNPPAPLFFHLSSFFSSLFLFLSFISSSSSSYPLSFVVLHRFSVFFLLSFFLFLLPPPPFNLLHPLARLISFIPSSESSSLHLFTRQPPVAEPASPTKKEAGGFWNWWLWLLRRHKAATDTRLGSCRGAEKKNDKATREQLPFFGPKPRPQTTENERSRWQWQKAGCQWQGIFSFSNHFDVFCLSQCRLNACLVVRSPAIESSSGRRKKKRSAGGVRWLVVIFGHFKGA